MVELLTETELRPIVRRSSITLRKWRASGRGPRWIKMEGRVLYPSRELATWLKAQPGGSGELLTAAAPKEM
jgi:hypothetical protein